jgi:hypothetical protein
VEKDQKKMRHPLFGLWLIVFGLVFSGLDLLYGIIPDLKNAKLFDPFVGLVAGFVLLCFVSAAGVARKKRLGYTSLCRRESSNCLPVDPTTLFF